MAAVPVQCTIMMTPEQAVEHFTHYPDGSSVVTYVMTSLCQAAPGINKTSVLPVAAAIKAQPSMFALFKGLIKVIEDPGSKESTDFIQTLHESTGSTGTGKTISDWAQVKTKISENKSWADRVAEDDEDDLAPELPPTPVKHVVKKLNQEDAPIAGPSEPSDTSPETVKYWLQMAEDDSEAFMKKFKQDSDVFNSYKPKRVVMCKDYKECPRGSSCWYAHSQFERKVMRVYWKKVYKKRDWEWKYNDVE